jgi:hypothetical protein
MYTYTYVPYTYIYVYIYVYIHIHNCTIDFSDDVLCVQLNPTVL